MSAQHKTLQRGLHLAIVIMAATLAAPATAETTAVGRFKDWAVFTETAGDDLICYAATEATSKSPARSNHGAVWYYVTSWKSGKARNQPSVKTGFNFKDDSSPKAKVGRSSWTLFPAGPELFSEDEDDAKIVSALRSGANLTVTGTSARGTAVTYKFSLSGSAAAIDKAAEACK